MIYGVLYKLKLIGRETLKKKRFEKSLKEALKRISSLEERIRMFKLHGLPRSLKESSDVEEIKHLEGLIVANKHILSVLERLLD